jgi:Holliday junction DNA helicase RuvB
MFLTDEEIAEQRAAILRGNRPAEPATTAPKPVGAADRSRNVLRPTSFDGMTGQDSAKRMLRRVVEQARDTGSALDHVLLVGPSGTGKSTFSHVLACELGVDVYEVEAPVSRDTLLELRTTMKDRDILRIEEIHQQAIMERRGRGAATEPEVLYNVLEDRTIVSGSGVLPFPEVTIVGTTTDEGLLPEPFLNRFPLRPRLERYSEAELKQLVIRNCRTLDLRVTHRGAEMLARAARGVPRQINNYVRNARSLGAEIVDISVAQEVLFDLNGVTEDGLTPDHQAMLTFLLDKGKRTNADGETYYQASVSTIATGIGKSRDVKAIHLRVEPYLIEKGYVQVTHGGRRLTDAGIQRAKELLNA